MKSYKSKIKYYNYEATEEFRVWNSKGYGIFFVPNGGGYKDTEINEYRSCFVDLDIKDEIQYEIYHQQREKNVESKFTSLTEDERLHYKRIFQQRIDELEKRGIPPSAIIETKNGFHVYYFLHQGAQQHQFANIEGLLIYALNADTAVKNPSRLLRVPGVQHLKNPMEPFEIQITRLNSHVRYDSDDLAAKLQNIQNAMEKESILFANPNKKPLYKSKVIPKIRGLPPRSAIDYSKLEIGNIPLISKGFEGLKELKIRLGLNYNADICYIDRSDIRQYLKRQDLMEFLGIDSTRFYCLFHQSSNPTSGSIYIHEDKYFYKCHSSNCGVHHDIIQIVERLTGLPVHKAFDYLKQLYNIAEFKTQWQHEQEQLIDINIDIIERFKYDAELRQSHPYLTKFLSTKGTLDLLIHIHELARRKLSQLAKVAEMDNAIVFAPMNVAVNEIINQRDSGLKNIDNANTKAVIMIFMYLLNCIGLEQLPSELQQKAKEFKKRGKEKNGVTMHHKYLSRYYEIVSLDTDRLILAEEMAKFFYQKHLTISEFKREQLLRICGKDEANRVFPDRIDEEVSDINKSIAQELQTLVNKLIGEKGWTNDIEIIESLVIPNFDLKQEYRNTYKYIKSKSSEVVDTLHIGDDDSKMLRWYHNFISKKLRINMPAIIEEFGLKKSRINKGLRCELKIPDHITGLIYHRLIESETIHIEDKATHIKRLKGEDSTLSCQQIATIVKCSKQYVSNTLRKSL